MHMQKDRKMAWGVFKDHKSVRLQGSVYFAVFKKINIQTPIIERKRFFFVDLETLC